MKVAFKSLIAAAAFIAAGAASAATVTVTLGNTVYKGHTLSGSETLSFGPDAKAWLDLIKGSVAANGASTVESTKDSDGFYTNVTMSAPLTSLNVDGVTDAIQTLASSGGITVTAPVLRAVSSGGALTVTDLNVDLNTKMVYATLVGGNGVGTVTNVALWTLDTVLGATSIAMPPDGGGVINLSMQGLHLTPDASTKFVTALGLSSLGRAALMAVSDFGTLSMAITSTVVLPQTTCTMSFKTTNRNAVLFNTEVTLANVGSDVANDWQVNWHYSKPTLVLNVKNAKVTNKSLVDYTATPGSANASIPAGGATTFTFRGHANGGAPTVSDVTATVGGKACAVTAQ